MPKGRPHKDRWRTPEIDGISVSQYVFLHINAVRQLQQEMERRLKESGQPKTRLFNTYELDEEFKLLLETIIKKEVA